MRHRQVYRSIERGAAWLHGEPDDVIHRLRLIKVGIVGVVALAAVVAVLLARPSEGVAFGGFLGDFNTEYGTDGSRIDSCLVCHVNADPDNDGGARNQYGKDWKDAGKSFAAIEDDDSDGDGATNITEILGFKFPGDAGDTPTSTKTFCQGVEATIVGTDGPDVLKGTAGKDVIAGLGGADKIYGYQGDDILCGNGGWDKIYPGKGNDQVDGGPGSRDLVNYANAKRGVVVSLRSGKGTGQGVDTIEKIESIIGSRFGDKLTGNSRSNRLTGGKGADSLFGRGGRDLMWGNAGRDNLVGGLGTDVARGGSGADTCAAEVTFSC